MKDGSLKLSYDLQCWGAGGGGEERERDRETVCVCVRECAQSWYICRVFWVLYFSGMENDDEKALTLKILNSL